MSLPKWVKGPEALHGRARTIWKSYAPRAFRDGSLTAANAELFLALCRSLAVAEAAGEEIEANGVTVKSNSGAVRPNPAVKLMFEAHREAQELLSKFGLADVDRGFRL
jgi:P27 family predicted phage terminase small subunit